MFKPAPHTKFLTGPRILVAQKAFQRSGISYGILLDQSAPPWLLAILENDLGIPPSEFEFFDATRERVLLRHALVPSRVFIGERIHPYVNDLLDSLLTELAPPPSPIRRAFITRGHFRNSAAPNRICVNEGALAAIARNYGFTPITPEDLTWREQIALFRDAQIVVGQAGSGLHIALFSRAGSRMASIGFMNLVQAQIGALRGQEMAYLCSPTLARNFSVDEKAFTDFIRSVSSSLC